MSLLEQARSALAGLSSPSSVQQSLELREGGQRFSGELAALDTLGCVFTHFALESDKLANAPIGELKQVAETLSKRLSYLLEPIQPVEVDPEHCVVQLRSNPPQREPGRVSYYELLVRRGGHLSLCRYEKQAGQVREGVPAHVTREVFLRLVSDFSAVA
jgi:hypothetical protein